MLLHRLILIDDLHTFSPFLSSSRTPYFCHFCGRITSTYTFWWMAILRRRRNATDKRFSVLMQRTHIPTFRKSWVAIKNYTRKSFRRINRWVHACHGQWAPMEPFFRQINCMGTHQSQLKSLLKCLVSEWHERLFQVIVNIANVPVSFWCTSKQRKNIWKFQAIFLLLATTFGFIYLIRCDETLFNSILSVF